MAGKLSQQLCVPHKQVTQTPQDWHCCPSSIHLLLTGRRCQPTARQQAVCRTVHHLLNQQAHVNEYQLGQTQQLDVRRDTCNSSTTTCHHSKLPAQPPAARHLHQYKPQPCHPATTPILLAPDQVHSHLHCGTNKANIPTSAARYKGLPRLSGSPEAYPCRSSSTVATTRSLNQKPSQSCRCATQPSLAANQVHSHLDSGAKQAEHAQHPGKVDRVAALLWVAACIALQIAGQWPQPSAFSTSTADSCLLCQQQPVHKTLLPHQSYIRLRTTGQWLQPDTFSVLGFVLQAFTCC